MEYYGDNQKDRKTYYDFLRVILVILVVIGHGSYYSIQTPFGGINYDALMLKAGITDTYFHRIVSYLTNYIYTFHMPVFIALSGSIYKIGGGNKYKFKELVEKKVKRLVIPFLFVWLFWNLPIKLLTGFYEGVSIGKIFLQMICPSGVYLWYLESLFFVFIIAYFILKLNEKKQIFLVGFSWIIGVILYMQYSQYHFFGNPFYYLFWFYLGYRVEDIINLLKIKNLWKNSQIFLLFTLTFILFCINSAKYCKILNGISIYIIYPLFMFIVLNYFVRRIDLHNRLVQKMSQYGMGIYLYAEPLNYSFLFLYYSVFGIEFFGMEKGAMLIYFSRILITPLIAVAITFFLKKLKLKYLY